MQPERNQKIGKDEPYRVRSYGSQAGFAFQDRDHVDKPLDTKHDWEWYSKGEAARLTYGGPDGEEKLIFDAQKGSLTINGNVEIGIAPSAKLHVNGRLKIGSFEIYEVTADDGHNNKITQLYFDRVVDKKKGI